MGPLPVTFCLFQGDIDNRSVSDYPLLGLFCITFPLAFSFIFLSLFSFKFALFSYFALSHSFSVSLSPFFYSLSFKLSSSLSSFIIFRAFRFLTVSLSHFSLFLCISFIYLFHYLYVCLFFSVPYSLIPFSFFFLCVLLSHSYFSIRKNFLLQ